LSGPHTIPRQRVSRPDRQHRRCGRLGAALDWLDNLGHERAAAYEHELLNYATAECPNSRPDRHGTSPSKAGVISFVLAGHKTEELGSALDREGSRCALATTAPSHPAPIWP